MEAYALALKEIAVYPTINACNRFAEAASELCNGQINPADYSEEEKKSVKKSNLPTARIVSIYLLAASWLLLLLQLAILWKRGPAKGSGRTVGIHGGGKAARLRRGVRRIFQNQQHVKRGDGVGQYKKAAKANPQTAARVRRASVRQKCISSFH